MNFQWDNSIEFFKSDLIMTRFKRINSKRSKLESFFFNKLKFIKIVVDYFKV